MSMPDQPLVLTVEEAAVLLRVSRGLAFAAVRAGTIPHLRIGRRILIPRAAFYDLLSADTTALGHGAQSSS